MSLDRIRVVTPARFGRRFAAFLIDVFIIGTAGGIITAAGTTAPVFLIDAAYFWLLAAWQGRTPGKMALGIEIHHRGHRLSIGRAFLREVVGKAIAFGAVFIGVVWIALDEEKRGWHDLIADTRAVRVETVSWLMAWEETIRKHLTAQAEASVEAFADFPEAWRPLILREFARRYPNEAALDGDVLRSLALVEEF